MFIYNICIYIYTYIVRVYVQELRVLRKPSFIIVSQVRGEGGGGEGRGIYGEGLLYMEETSDQIMPKEGELYKRIFQ